MRELRCCAAQLPGLEAWRNPVFTILPVSTIAYSLGFSDPAYFSRLFSGATGHSPRSFRDKVHTGG